MLSRCYEARYQNSLISAGEAVYHGMLARLKSCSTEPQTFRLNPFSTPLLPALRYVLHTEEHYASNTGLSICFCRLFCVFFPTCLTCLCSLSPSGCRFGSSSNLPRRRCRASLSLEPAESGPIVTAQGTFACGTCLEQAQNTPRPWELLRRSLAQARGQTSAFRGPCKKLLGSIFHMSYISPQPERPPPFPILAPPGSPWPLVLRPTHPHPLPRLQRVLCILFQPRNLALLTLPPKAEVFIWWPGSSVSSGSQ